MTGSKGASKALGSGRVFGIVALLVLVGIVIAAPGSAARRVAKPSIRVVSASIANQRIVVTVRVSGAPKGARWKLRLDGKQLPGHSLGVRSASTPFLAPGKHTVQALLLTARLSSAAVSPARSLHVDALVAAAGDIACEPGQATTATECHQAATAALLGQRHYSAIFTLGDEQYECGSADGYAGSYASTWGKYKAITHPSPGDHEYGTTKLGCAKGTNAVGYFSYWGKAAGDPTKGYYSYDLGGWHVVVLNSNCLDVPCAQGSAQEQWLAADLAAHPSPCTVAYFHEPRFTSGLAGDNTLMAAFWSDLYAAHVDLVLNGHAHVYERFAPQNPDGVAADDGITEFVVGTGGRSLSGFQATPEATSVVRQNTTFGILSLDLGATGFSWRFVPEAGKTFTDSGSARCH